MKKLSVPVLLLSLALALPALAKEKAGVNLPDRVTVEGKNLTLNGIGLRTKLIFKVYVAGLYLENPSNNAEQVIHSDQVKRVQMVMLRDLEKEKVAEAVRNGFEKNNKEQMPALKQRLDNLVAEIPDFKKGESFVITYLPGKGVTMTNKAGQVVTVPGKDFGDALFSVWLGQNPVDGGLRDEMLGKKG